MIQKTIINNISSDVIAPYIERLNDHNLNSVFEETSICYTGHISEAFALYRTPSTDNFPKYFLQEPGTVFQDTWYTTGDRLALYLLDKPYILTEDVFLSIRERLLERWGKQEDSDFYIKPLKSDTFMNSPISKSRWALFCWCDGNLLVISFEPTTGVIALDCANSGEEWNGNTEENFNLIFSILENELVID